MKVRSVVERRLLVSYALDPEVARRVVPAQFELSLAGGWAVGGICLIRLGQVRPSGAPAFVGFRSENAAHRISVELDGRPGVYIPRRDTASLATVAAGGLLFPGVHHRARFTAVESPSAVEVAFESADRAAHVRVRATIGAELRGSRLFESTEAASEFYRQASVAYSETRGGRVLDGVEIHPDGWVTEPIADLDVVSSYFDDPERFPTGSAILDSALIMRDLPASWAPRPQVHVA